MKNGILKAMSNGQQSFAHQAKIKVSCISNVLLSVLLCTTLKPDIKIFWELSIGLTKTEKESIKWICDLCCLAICFYLYSTLHSLPVTIGNFTNSVASKVIATRMAFYWIFKQNIPSWSSRMERQLDEQDRR